MDEGLPSEVAEKRRCVHVWCVSEHGATVHPDDEDHRSAGVSVTVRARRGDARGPGEETELELGALRRADDLETWIVIETGIGVSLALTREGAQLLERRLRSEIGPGGALNRDDIDR